MVMKYWLQTIIACCKQLSLIGHILLFQAKGSVLSVRKTINSTVFPFLCKGSGLNMFCCTCCTTQFEMGMSSHQCLGKHAITA